MLTYISLPIKDFPLWAQMFNITVRNTKAKASIQNDQERALRSQIGMCKKIDKKHNP